FAFGRVEHVLKSGAATIAVTVWSADSKVWRYVASTLARDTQRICANDHPVASCRCCYLYVHLVDSGAGATGFRRESATTAAGFCYSAGDRRSDGASHLNRARE